MQGSASAVEFYLASPSPAFPRGRSKKKKKKTPWVVFFFFALAPCRLPTGLLLPLPFAGAAAKKKTPWVFFFFLLWPRAGAQRGFSFPCLSLGPEQKQTPWVVFFFLLWPAERSRRPTERNKKKTLCTPGADSKKISRNQ